MSRPLITFIQLGYNQESLVREGLQSVFSQTYTPLQIVLSDDASTDATFAVMQEAAAAYRGPHEVCLNRNARNTGTGGHINRAMELAKGELIVIAAGDDISLPHRTERTYEAWERTGRKAKSLFSHVTIIDELGTVGGTDRAPMLRAEDLQLDRLLGKRKPFGFGCGAAHAWSREVFDVFGPMLTPVALEDCVIPFRSALLGGIEYIDECLVMHRRHSGNTWKCGGEDYDHLDECFRVRRFLANQTVAIYDNWLHDLSILSRVRPERQRELERAISRATRRLAFSRRQRALYESGYLGRLFGMGMSVFEGSSASELRQNIGMFLMPSIYARYLRAKGQRERATLA